VFWALRESAVLKNAGIDPLELAEEVKKLLARFPNAKVNPDEQRQLRASLYRPLISLPRDARAGVVDLIIANVLG
jgi:type I restriction enzyme R subunit